MLLAREGAHAPSVLLIRWLTGRRAADQAAVILANLETVEDDLNAGAVVVLTDDWPDRCLPGYEPAVARNWVAASSA
jgi:hypothetical protein